VSFEATTHPLPQAVYRKILQDEALHRRLGGLYFEWALPRIDDAERRRLGQILGGSIRALSPFWMSSRARGVEGPVLPEDELRRLGWPDPSRFAPVALEVTLRDIVEPLATIGIELSTEDRLFLSPTG
jgi:hypothetical protein